MTVYPISPALQISMKFKLICNDPIVGATALDHNQQSIDGTEASAINIECQLPKKLLSLAEDSGY